MGRTQELAGNRPQTLPGASKACRAPRKRAEVGSDDDSIERHGWSAFALLSIVCIFLAERRAARLCNRNRQAGVWARALEAARERQADFCDSVSDSFRVISPEDFRVMT